MATDETGVLTVTDDSFDRDVIAAPGPILVDFWATWCGPSRLVAPALERLARERGSKVAVARIDVDQNPLSRYRYSVPGLPTQLLFKGGVVLRRIEGAQTFDFNALVKVIDALC